MKVIDISEHQGYVDFSKVAKEVDGVILRCSYGTILDKRFYEYARGCKEYKIPLLGLYVFDYSLSDADAQDEAAYACQLADEIQLGKDAVIWYDMEGDSVRYATQMGKKIDASDCQRRTKIFCDYVLNHGYQTGFYANLDWMKNRYAGFEYKDKYHFWYARYADSKEYDCDVWQYTSSAKIAGISTDVDMNDYTLKNFNEEEVSSMSKIDEFYKYAAGKAWDKYGKYWNVSSAGTASTNFAGQCVSLIKTYLYYLFPGKVKDSYGDAKDYWNNRNSNGILDLCSVASTMKDGDIVVSTGSDARYGHIWIYYQRQAFTQNCAGNPKATLYPLSWQGSVVGILRPKITDAGGIQLEDEHRIATVLKGHNINIRKGSPTGTVVRTAPAGTKIEYTQKCVTNGHRYISWIENNTRMYMAVTPTEARSDYWVSIAPLPEKWNANGIVKVGSTVKTNSVAIANVSGTNSPFKDGCVNVPALGGLIPLKDVTEAADTKDGKNDDILMNNKARVYLNPVKVTEVDVKKDLAKVNGYWVKCAPLLVKE